MKIEAVEYWKAQMSIVCIARSYMSIRVLSAPAAIALFGVMGWLIALERTRQLFAVQFTMNALNIGLDLLFVLGFGWGVEGVAVATAIAEWTGLGLGLWSVDGRTRVCCRATAV